MAKNLQAEFFIGNEWLVKIGQMSKQHQANYEIKKNVFVAVFNFKTMVKYYKPIAQYIPINHFAVIKLDQTFENRTYEDIKNKAFKSKLLQKIEVVSTFKNKLTLRFYFSANSRNITEEKAKKELTNIQSVLL